MVSAGGTFWKKEYIDLYRQKTPTTLPPPDGTVMWIWKSVDSDELEAQEQLIQVSVAPTTSVYRVNPQQP